MAAMESSSAGSGGTQQQQQPASTATNVTQWTPLNVAAGRPKERPAFECDSLDDYLAPECKRTDVTSHKERTMLDVDEHIYKSGRFRIMGIIGDGGFGQIFMAEDLWLGGNKVAVKVGSKRRDKDTQRMALEVDVFRRLNELGCKHVPFFYVCSEMVGQYNYIVMQLVGKCMSELRRASPKGYLSVSTSVRVISQALRALGDLHAIGYLHRDIKPSNITMGAHRATTARVAYLLDFGLVRWYKDTGGNARRPRTRAGFRGTQRYVSVRVHDRLEQCRADDCWSLFYSLSELVHGSLPWRNITDMEKTRRAKLSANADGNSSSVLCRHMPDGCRAFFAAVSKLQYEDGPNYAAMQQQLAAALAQVAADWADPYDWERSGTGTGTGTGDSEAPRWRPVIDEFRPSVAAGRSLAATGTQHTLLQHTAVADNRML